MNECVGQLDLNYKQDGFLKRKVPLRVKCVSCGDGMFHKLVDKDSSLKEVHGIQWHVSSCQKENKTKGKFFPINGKRTEDKLHNGIDLSESYFIFWVFCFCFPYGLRETGLIEIKHNEILIYDNKLLAFLF